MRLVDRLSDLLGLVAAWLFFLTGLMLSYEVTARYVFNAPTIWAAEISQLVLIWGVFLAPARILRRRQNIRIDFLYDRVSAAWRSRADVLSLLIILAFSAVVIWYGGWIAWDSFVRSRSTGSMLNIPNWWSESAVPFGFAVLSLQALVELARIWMGADASPRGADGPTDRDGKGDGAGEEAVP